MPPVNTAGTPVSPSKRSTARKSSSWDPNKPAAACKPGAFLGEAVSALPGRVPAETPPFTVRDLRAAIPKHCFERSLVKSFGYLFVDLVLVWLCYQGALRIDSTLSAERLGVSARVAAVLQSAVWVLYWCVQGCFMTGLWVIGHECGHGGFADSVVVNDAVGVVVHSALLVPYWSWKVSHRRHHSNTGNVARDEVFVPPHRHEVDTDNPLLFSAPVRAAQIVLTLTVGWFAYLGANVSGRKYPEGGWVNHFHPYSPIFSKKERKYIIASDVALLFTLAVLYKIGAAYGFVWLAKVYVVPYFIVNFWLVLITLLQHTDEALPHYEDSEWDWLRGALATVDRDYGILNVVFHHITDTHVAHHLFSSMPHYHAQEATEAIKKVIGDYYRFDNRSIAQTLWRVYRECAWLEEEDQKGVLWFHSPQGKGNGKEE